MKLVVLAQVLGDETFAFQRLFRRLSALSLTGA
jgi:hypothetical protein